jgi:Ca-activated chloride channel family protein
MLRLASPYYLLLLIPAAAGAFFVLRRRTRSGLLFSATGRLPSATRSWRIATARLCPFLFLAGLAAITLALSRPQTVLSRSHRTSDVIAIEMVADVSGSMEALDMSRKTATGWEYRTRLDAVKDAFREFVEQRPRDLIGLVTFGGYATTRCPLTLDHRALLHILEGVEVPDPERDSSGEITDPEELMTAIGDALATACARLKEAQAESRIAVLLSDGESNTGAVEPMEAVKVAEKLGIKVYTIGVGSTGLAAFMVDTPLGSRRIRRRVVLDEELLRAIADRTGGKYFNVKDKEGLQQALGEIDKLEKTEIEREVYYRYRELYRWFLVPGLALLLLGASLNMLCAQRIV